MGHVMYTDVELRIWDIYYDRETEKAQCFTLWGKKFLAFPKKFIKNWRYEGDGIFFTMPKWFIDQHSLKSLVSDEEVKSVLFPLKRDLKKQREELEKPSLNFDEKEETATKPLIKLEELPPWF